MKLVFTTGLALWLLGGCVIMDSTLTLEPTPAMDAIARSDRSVFLARVTDRRPDTGRIGCKKNGIGSESADLFLDVSLTDWFGGVMNDKLRRSGLRLAGAEEARAVRVEVDLLDFFIEPETSLLSSYRVYAMVNADVTVRFPDGRAFARRFTSHFDDTSMVPTDGSYEEAMQEAMLAWIREALPAIVHLVEADGRIQAQAHGWARRVRS